MKKFLSMALAVVMACNFALLSSENIGAALCENYDYDYDYNYLDYQGCDDDYAYFRADERYLKELMKDSRVNFIQYDGKYFIIKIHKEDLKEIIEEKPSKLRKLLKAALWVTFGYASAGGYHLLNEKLVKPNDGAANNSATTTETNSNQGPVYSFVKGMVIRNNEFLSYQVYPMLLDSNIMFNRGINAAKTFLDKIWHFGKKTNSSNTQQPTNSSNTKPQQQTNSSNTQQPTNSSNTQSPSSTNTQQPTNSSNTKPQQQTNSSNTQQPTNGAGKNQQPQSTPSPTPIPKPPVETPQPKPEENQNPTDTQQQTKGDNANTQPPTNGADKDQQPQSTPSPTPISKPQVETETPQTPSSTEPPQASPSPTPEVQMEENNEQQGNNCEKGFHEEGGKCVPDQQKENNGQ